MERRKQMNNYQYNLRGYELVPMPIPFLDNRCKQTGRFINGHKSWNKGLKGICTGGIETQYKPGNEPHNTKYDGCISLRTHKRDGNTYKYIRISKGLWQLLNRYVWEKAHGSIPPKHIIAFKDGNTLNCELSNLTMLSMAENVRRNYNAIKASESMAKAWNSERIRAKYDLPRKTKLRIK